MHNAIGKSCTFATALGTLAVSTTTLASDPLTIVSWGESYEVSQTRAYHEPYTEMTGTEIVEVSI